MTSHTHAVASQPSFLWGRMATCGRLSIGLPLASGNLPYVGQPILAAAAFQAGACRGRLLERAA